MAEQVQNEKSNDSSVQKSDSNVQTKKYKCSVCGAEYNSRSGLKYHMEHSHGQKQDVEKLQIEETKPQKKEEKKEEKKFNLSNKWIILAVVLLILFLVAFLFFNKPKPVVGGQNVGIYRY